jgi:hypothetical protein
MKQTVLTIVVVVAALVGAPTAAAGDTTCVETLTETYDNVVVPAGAHCHLLGARVKGNVLVLRDATLSIVSDPIGSGGLGLGNPTVVEGNVQAENARSLGITASQVRGNVQVKGASEGMVSLLAFIGGNIQVEGMAGRLSLAISGIGGGLEVTKSSGRIELGLISITGSVKIADNVVPNTGAGMVLDSVRTSGDLKVLNNRGPGPKRVAGSIVAGSLECFGNTATFVGGPNTAGKRKGQCF